MVFVVRVVRHLNFLQPFTGQIKESAGCDMQHAAHPKSLDNQSLMVANNSVLTNECRCFVVQ